MPHVLAPAHLVIRALLYTVELRSKGPGRKGNPPLRERISGPINHFPIYFYIREFQSMGKIRLVP